MIEKKPKEEKNINLMENMMCQSNFFLILHYSAAASLSLFT